MANRRLGSCARSAPQACARQHPGGARGRAPPGGDPRRQGGVTLLELLVAIAIFGLVSAMAYGGLMTVMETRERVEAEGERLGELQLATGVLARDIRQHIDRGWRDAWGDRQPSIRFDPLATDPRLELVRAGGRIGAERSELRRIGYEVADGVLYRLAWPYLDAGDDAGPARSRIAGSGAEEARRIEALELRFHYRPSGAATDGSAAVETAPRWPPTDVDRAPERLLAVEVELRLGDGGTITRIFPIRSGTAGGEGDAARG